MARIDQQEAEKTLALLHELGEAEKEMDLLKEAAVNSV